MKVDLNPRFTWNIPHETGEIEGLSKHQPQAVNPEFTVGLMRSYRIISE